MWFAGNGVMNELVSTFDLSASALGHITSSVQFGFICGTLLFALLTLADRFPPSKVFMISALAGAIFNGVVIWEGNTFASLITLRFLTGFFLAGIYPVGMKIAADYYEKGLGKSLGLLVGALVVGTAFPHLLNGTSETLPWNLVIIGTSCLSIIGGLMMYLMVPNGPFQKPGQKIDLSASFKVFRNSEFRSAAFGYFGHMWELYAFWAFVPLMLSTYNTVHPEEKLNVSLFSFAIIGIGGIACVIGGYLSLKMGTKRTAFIALMLSCLCCLASPLLFLTDSKLIITIFLLFWGMVVVADSPLFSTLVAHNTQAETKGTALTIVNCLGFSITIMSIQLLTALQTSMNSTYVYALLAIGPIFGLFALYNGKRSLYSP